MTTTTDTTSRTTTATSKATRSASPTAERRETRRRVWLERHRHRLLTEWRKQLPYTATLPARGYSPEALATFPALKGELAEHLADRPTDDPVRSFLAAGTTDTDTLDRYATVRTLELLAWPSAPAVWHLRHTATRAERGRLLTDIEQGLVRLAAAHHNIERCVLIGALDGGATTREMSGRGLPVLVRDADGNLTGIFVGGVTRRHDRIIPTKPWWHHDLVELAADVDPTTRPLLYRGDQHDIDRIDTSLLMAVRAVFTTAGIAGDKRVTPQSIANTSARHILDDHGLEAAAAFLGEPNLLTVLEKLTAAT